MAGPACKRLNHALLPRRSVVPPRLGDLRELLERVGRKDRSTREDGGPLRVQTDHELGDDTEIRAAATNAPEEVGVLGRVRSANSTIRCNDSGLGM